MNHDVTNQVPLFEGRNLFTSDPFLKRIVTTLTENNFAELLTTFGAACGTKERFEAGRLANENPPKLKTSTGLGTEQMKLSITRAIMNSCDLV